MLFDICFFLLSVPVFVQSLDPTFNDDVLGLIVFKAGLQDPESKLASWNEDDENPCNWVGVKCDPKTQRVTELVLDGFSLSGHIGRGLLRLQFLQILSLSNNNFTGTINPDLAQLGVLQVVDLSQNNLSGLIPDGFFKQCGSLRSVSFAKNNLTGQIPESLSWCTSLAAVNFSSNQLSGELPSGLFFLRGLQSLDLSDNLLEGEIPEGISNLAYLTTINLQKNRFSGKLPVDIGGCLLLKVLDFSENSLSDLLPESLRRLRSCTSLRLRGNSFAGEVPGWIGELTNLDILDLSANEFMGRIPTSIGNLNILKELNLSRNHLTGGLPQPVTNCLNLLVIDVSQNRLTGILPPWILKMGLKSVSLSGNGHSKGVQYPSVASLASSLQGLKVLDLSSNVLSGEIPSDVGVVSSLLVLNISRNRLFGSIPSSIRELKMIQVLDLSHNKLKGRIPSEIGGAVSLVELRLEKNCLTGNIPTQIKNCSSLKSLILSQNNLTGPVPAAIANISNLQYVDLSFNHLSGSLPKELTNLSYLVSFNVSHNNLQAAFIALGVVAVSLLNIHVRSSMTPTPVSLALSGGEDFSCSPTTDPNYGKLVMFSGDTDFVAGAHALLNKDCELGRGGFGVVYRTILRDGRSVAIKKLTVSSLIKSQDEFEREVKRLGKIKHHNLVALEGYYWTSSLQLLIYEYISSGSLYKHLHDGPSSNCLSWRQRFNIILGMAKGLAHLHHMNITHYNLKSTNILIDDTGEPKVGDFGLARLLPTLDRCILSSKIQSALGYMAPEFACRTVKITEKCDVYGFGILVLEVVTGKRPVEYMEDDVVVLCDMVRGALEDGRMEDCVDGRLGGKFPADEAIPVIKLGLICASQVPSNRPDMEEVVNILELIQCPAGDQEELE
ncbi:probable LRR receptor-like serine/threonine-protein kinase IRK isoform X3 [Hevea brasiliensis]|uniref:probable LRR receptor-like serine/threonine-protein kinase IRK isoform X3 n=1 Tax=Hevea brasiliensis TaxID=3981 RepID=UPI0025CFFBB8|nr:probable LRR receptor-like serine/threonine-protein kinase IRK isoform X3 [Hevea brasiliensis]